jgi:predicted helicase
MGHPAPSITKLDVFHFIYAVLHCPEYRERCAANLRRELLRVPFAAAAHPNGCHFESGQGGGGGAAVLRGTSEQQVPHRVFDSVRNDNRKWGGSSYPLILLAAGDGADDYEWFFS